VLNSEALLEDLTDAQREAVTHVDGPLLIVAGAGSGKTRVITRRVAHLVSLGIPASSILAITFTNKAAGEMKNRVSAVLDRPVRDFGRLDQPWPTICTFHSLCLRILRHYAQHVGLPHNFSIFDSADQTKLVKEALKALDLSSTNFPPGTVHGAIGDAKNKLLSPEQYAANVHDFYGRTVARVYIKYQDLLKQNNALDFDDLLLRTAQAFRDHKDVLEELQQRWQYILIDEYQDTNHAQYVIAHALAMKHRNICVVGDPDQSIYAWRGADIKNILEFERDYPDAKVVRLEQNYRSTKTILAIASKLIANNLQRKDKGLWTENGQGEPAELYLCQDEHDEAQVVMRRLKELNEKQGIAWNRMAIFYRMNSLSRVMEEALFKAKVPYQIARGVEFYNRKEIKDVLAYLRVVANPSDEVSLGRIVNVPPRGLGEGAMEKIQAYAVGTGMSIFEAMGDAGKVTGLTTRAVNSAKSFVELVRKWREIARLGQEGETRGQGDTETRRAEGGGELQFEPAQPKGDVQTLMESVVRTSGYDDLLKKLDKEKEEGERPSDNVGELINAAAEFDREQPEGTLYDYLAQVSLVSDADHLKGAGGAVTLMTLHAAKGLEFPVVAMIGLEDGILPHSRARDNMSELEEERRLCFVGITRAQQYLIISKAQTRAFRGSRERTITSPFLNELPQEFLRVTDRTGLEGIDRAGDDDGGWGRSDGYPKKEDEGAQFRRGQMVRHPTFGIGRVADVSQAGQHTRAVVEFNTVGRKTLILQYARLEPVG
jgi:DNA helicase II / ATP-dependent DNA helicase PcrA